MRILAAYAEFRDELLVTRIIFALYIIQKFPARGDHCKKPAARMVVFFIRLKMFSQIVNTLREDRDLYFRRACIALVYGELFDKLSLFFFCNRHRYLSSIGLSGRVEHSFR